MRPRTFAFLIIVLIAGCKSDPGLRRDPVEISGMLVLPGGQPAKDMTVVFLPSSSDQFQGYGTVGKDGKFQAKLIPGKYTYMIEGKNGATKGIPGKYLENNPDNVIEITGGNNITIKLEN